MRILVAAVLAVLLFGLLFAAKCPTGEVPGFYRTEKNGSDCVVTYQPGAQHGKDSWVYDQWPQYNYGASPYMNVETAQSEGGYGRYGFPLLQFDLSAIPKNATIKSAELRLFKFGCRQEHTQCRETKVEAYRLLAPWEEGSCSDAAGCPGQSSWDYPGSAQSSEWHGSLPQWTHEAQPQDRTLSPLQESAWISFNLTRAAKGWVNGSFPNYGITLQGIYDSNADYQRHSYRTSDYDDPFLRPMLIVVYNNTNSNVSISVSGMPSTAVQGESSGAQIVLNNTGETDLQNGTFYIRRAEDGQVVFERKVSLKKGESLKLDGVNLSFAQPGVQRYQFGAVFEEAKDEKELSVAVLPAPKADDFSGPLFLALSVGVAFAAFLLLAAVYISLGKGKGAQGKTKCPMCGYVGTGGRCPVCGTAY